MHSELISWPNKLSQGKQVAITCINHYPSLLKSQKRFIFAGMGGSGIAGRILQTFLSKESTSQAIILDGPELPAFVNSQDFAFVVSYSGNTWETLEIAKKLKTQKIPMLILTHGGNLQQMARDHQIPCAILPECSAPRAALGYMLGFLVELLAHYGFISNYLENWQQSLKKHLPCLSEQNHYSDFLNMVGFDDFFHIWGITGDSSAVAYRAQTQFNENSKVQAVFSSFPELNHNLLVGLTNFKKAPFILLFSTDFISNELNTSQKSILSILKDLGVRLYKTPNFGDTWQEQLFMMIVWADFASYYLGKIRKVDIISTKVIDQLKASYLSNSQTP
jgi:glucose/mannose-6-phosphate isomerase